MKKRVLLIHYSQAGQTGRAFEILKRAFSVLWSCDTARIQVQQPYAFPWSMGRFFRIFPLCVLGRSPELVSLQLDDSSQGKEIKWDQYDLVVLGYQVWFLSPSLPIQAFLNLPMAHNLKNKKVLAVCTCRNLWYSASRLVKERVLQLGSDWLGQVTLCERSPLWASFVTTPRWMLTGRRNAFAFFPAAGVLDEDFEKFEAQAYRFAKLWSEQQQGSVSLTSWNESNLDRLSLRYMDKIGRRFFEFWARILDLLAPRPGLWQDLLLIVFRMNLIALIVCVAPGTRLIELCQRRQLKPYA